MTSTSHFSASGCPLANKVKGKGYEVTGSSSSANGGSPSSSSLSPKYSASSAAGNASSAALAASSFVSRLSSGFGGYGGQPLGGAATADGLLTSLSPEKGLGKGLEPMETDSSEKVSFLSCMRLDLCLYIF